MECGDLKSHERPPRWFSLLVWLQPTSLVARAPKAKKNDRSGKAAHQLTVKVNCAAFAVGDGRMGAL